MNKLIKSLAAGATALAATTTHASADVALWIMNDARHGRARPSHGRGHGNGHGHGDGLPSAPEIDLSQAASAIVIVLIAFLLIREVYLRQRQPA
ncbi:MAG: hypothetical protein R3C30_05895 [Hyphomonadaceae bacterium]